MWYFMYSIIVCMHMFTYTRVSSSGGGGGKLPPQNTSFPPKKKERKKKREGEREREKEREVHGGGRGACIFLCRIASDQYSVLLHDSII